MTSTAHIGTLDSSQSASPETLSSRSGIRTLARDKVIRLEQRSGIKRIEIKTGVVWLTSTPAKGDILLRVGDVFECQKNWPYVIEALEHSELSCSCA
ncbi:MAG TPA: DUF2917 domain-containing protein [Verrucomicrobiae bacterium]|jgi:hypothetical protein|nr:DUF2917 domain-containing protein [Verrucomicrobiae bacterium]